MTLQEKILLLCKNPISIEKLSAELNTSLFIVQSLLIDLHLAEKIEQNNFGDWVIVNQKAHKIYDESDLIIKDLKNNIPQEIMKVEEINESFSSRNNPQLSCTITLKDQELLNLLVVYFTNKEGKPVNTSTVIRRLIRFGNQFKDQISLKEEEEEFRMTLRVPESFIERLDEKCKKRTGNISRNQMIVEILDDYL